MWICDGWNGLMNVCWWCRYCKSCMSSRCQTKGQWSAGWLYLLKFHVLRLCFCAMMGFSSRSSCVLTCLTISVMVLFCLKRLCRVCVFERYSVTYMVWTCAVEKNNNTFMMWYDIKYIQYSFSVACDVSVK